GDDLPLLPVPPRPAPAPDDGLLQPRRLPALLAGEGRRGPGPGGAGRPRVGRDGLRLAAPRRGGPRGGPRGGGAGPPRPPPRAPARPRPRPPRRRADRAPLPRPLLGYVGTMEDRVDWPLVGRLADAFPRGSVVLIGRPLPAGRHKEPWTAAYRDCLARPNVHA